MKRFADFFPKSGSNICLDEEQIKYCIKAVVQKLIEYHAKGSLHRDVQASNLSLWDDGTVTLGITTW